MTVGVIMIEPYYLFPQYVLRKFQIKWYKCHEDIMKS
jgi:hypothetical protein